MGDANTTYQPGDEIDISGTTIIITKKGFSGTPRYGWYCPAAMEGAEVTYPTVDGAIAHAYRTLGTECRHGQMQFCLDCHDQER
jgi:hypothetical protein